MSHGQAVLGKGNSAVVGQANSDQISSGAGEAGVLVSALEHPMVLAALSRMASTGAWQCVVDGQPLAEELDLVDAEFLRAAGAVTRLGDDTFRLAVTDPLYSNCEALAQWSQYSLRRALRHATGDSMRWVDEDPEALLAFGRASGRAADVFADLLLPQLPEIAEEFAAGRGSFLDVGVGVGAISVRLVERFPGTSAVGLEVLPAVLDLARAELVRSGLMGAVELRLQSVADLEDRERYDLAWVPHAFIPQAALLPGLGNVLRALKPGGAAVLPAALISGTPGFSHARLVHSTRLAGGSSLTMSELVEALGAAGFVDLVEHPVGAQVLMTATRPAAA